ncbi:MAG: DNA polymerase [Planctomycetes bacterium]|nr:DNA polymerase [Planctomycetota bacterium]
MFGMSLRYLFVDMNSYFASVEQQTNPGLRGRPVGIVPMMTDSTCCIAASYEAKAFGVSTGTGVREARRLCPKIALVEARPQVYVEYHHRIVEAVESCLHVDCVSSIDEMYGRLMGVEREPQQAAAIAFNVKAAIRRVGEALRCSIGIAPNAWLAKVASDMVKPDGMTMILPDQLPEALYRLKLTDLPGIATRMSQRLESRGIRHVHQLCAAGEAELAAAWGSKVLGAIWYQQLRGVDLPYRPTRRGTVGHSHVLPPDQRNERDAYRVTVRMLHKAAHRMRRLGYHASRLTARVSFIGGGRWEQYAGLPQTRDTLTMIAVLQTLWSHKPIREPLKVGVELSELTADACATLPLYAAQARHEMLGDVMDRINERFGRDAIYSAVMLGVKHAAPTRISFTQIPAADEFG